MNELDPGSFTALETKALSNDFASPDIDHPSGPGSSVLRCFIAPGAARNPFNHSRLFIALDGTFTKTRYGFILLIAITMDQEDKALALAWALVDGETKHNW